MAEAPKIKHDWYQTETHVVVEVRIKGLKSDEVKVEFGAASLSVTAKLPPPSSSEYSLELDLAHPIVEAECSHKVLGTKLEIRDLSNRTSHFSSHLSSSYTHKQPSNLGGLIYWSLLGLCHATLY